jgi:hypothetical protein
MHLKKPVVVLFVLIFAAAMFHFFYGEDHCPSGLPSTGGGFCQVHHHHGNASTCLSFLSGLFGPETADWDGAAVLRIALAPPVEGRPSPSLGVDISHPPNVFPA